MSRAATYWAVLMAIAKQMPWAGAMTAVLMPTTSPAEFRSGPPELPGFKAASVWIRLSIRWPFDFAGWEMPLHYTGGIVSEHLATRKHAGLFDVSPRARRRCW